MAGREVKGEGRRRVVSHNMELGSFGGTCRFARPGETSAVYLFAGRVHFPVIQLGHVEGNGPP